MSEMSEQIHVGVACGGYSSEREVSLNSGKKIAESLSRLGYHVSVIDPITDLQKLLSVSIVFNVVHGAYGEDGTLHSFLDLYNIPYVGSPPAASIMSMNKVMTKQLLRINNIPTPEYKVLFSSLTQLPSEFSYPVFLKPISGGSSIDTFLIENEDSLLTYSTQLYTQYHHYLLESFIEGTEVTASIIDHPESVALPLLELRPTGTFYDYHSKYTRGMTSFIIPASLSHHHTKLCQEMALNTHQLIGCSGFSRTDIIVSDQDGPYVLEINSLPGMTDLSDLPAQALSYGLSYDELIDSLVKTTLSTRRSSECSVECPSE
jgi:D-alanine-D-alanine ligase